jgi:hypothetical protein
VPADVGVLPAVGLSNTQGRRVSDKDTIKVKRDRRGKLAPKAVDCRHGDGALGGVGAAGEGA